MAQFELALILVPDEKQKSVSAENATCNLQEREEFWGTAFSGPSKLVIIVISWTKIQPLLKTDLFHHTLNRHPIHEGWIDGGKFQLLTKLSYFHILCWNFCADSMTRLNWKVSSLCEGKVSSWLHTTTHPLELVVSTHWSQCCVKTVVAFVWELGVNIWAPCLS